MTDKSFLKEKIDSEAALIGGLNPIVGQSAQEQEKFRIPDGGKGNYELKFYIKDQGSIMDSGDESEFGGPRDDQWIDFSDRCEINGRNSLTDIGTITHSIEGRNPNSFKTNTQGVSVVTEDYFYDNPLKHSLFTINGSKAFFEKSEGGENYSWYRREVKITLRQADGEIAVEKDLGHFLIEMVNTDSESGIAKLKLVGLEKPLIEKDADTVKDGRHWYLNRTIKFLAEELLKTEYNQVINEKEELRDNDVVSVRSFSSLDETPLFTDYGKPIVTSIGTAFTHSIDARLILNTTSNNIVNFGDTTIVISSIPSGLDMKEGDVLTIGTDDSKNNREKVTIIKDKLCATTTNVTVEITPIVNDYNSTVTISRGIIYLGITKPNLDSATVEIWALDPDRQEFAVVMNTFESGAPFTGLKIRKLYFDQINKKLIGACFADRSSARSVTGKLVKLTIDESKLWNIIHLSHDTNSNKGISNFFPGHLHYRDSDDTLGIYKSLVDGPEKPSSFSINGQGKFGIQGIGQFPDISIKYTKPSKVDFLLLSVNI